MLKRISITLFLLAASAFGSVTKLDTNTQIKNLNCTIYVFAGTNQLQAYLNAGGRVCVIGNQTQTTSALTGTVADTALQFFLGSKLTQTTNGVDVLQITGARFGMFGGTLDCNNNTLAAYALKINADYTNVDRTIVQNCGANGSNGLIAIQGGVNHRLTRNIVFGQTSTNAEDGIVVKSAVGLISGTSIDHNYVENFNDKNGIKVWKTSSFDLFDVSVVLNNIHAAGSGVDVHADDINGGPLNMKLIGNGVVATAVSGNPMFSIFGMKASVLALNTGWAQGFFRNGGPFLGVHDTYSSSIVGNSGHLAGATARLVFSLDAAHNSYVGNTALGANTPSGGAFEGSTAAGSAPWSDNVVAANNVNLDTGAGIDCFLAWPNSTTATMFRNQWIGNQCDGNSTVGSTGLELKIGVGTGGDNFVAPNKWSNLEQGILVGTGITSTTILPQDFTNVPVKYNISDPSTQLKSVFHAGEQDFYPTTTTKGSVLIPATMEAPPLAPVLTCSNTGGSLAAGTHFFYFTYNNGTANYTGISPEASCATTGTTGSVSVPKPKYYPANATGHSVWDSNTTGTATKLLQATCQNITATCTVTVLAAGAALSTTPTASANPTGCTPTSGKVCGTSSDGTIAKNKLQYHNGNSNNTLDHGQLISRTTLTTGTTFTPSATTTTILVQLCAAGGGSGGVTGTASQSAAAGGGGAGSYAEKLFAVTPSVGLTYAIGAGGTAGANTGTAGGTGGVTTFTATGVTVTTNGGLGGAGMLTGTTVLIAAGGNGGAVSTNGDVNGTGEPGMTGIRVAAGTAISGGGGPSFYAGGGNPIVSASSVGNVGGFCAGASGSANIGNAAQVGAVGGAGLIVVTEYQ